MEWEKEVAEGKLLLCFLFFSCRKKFLGSRGLGEQSCSGHCIG